MLSWIWSSNPNSNPNPNPNLTLTFLYYIEGTMLSWIWYSVHFGARQTQHSNRLLNGK